MGSSRSLVGRPCRQADPRSRHPRRHFALRRVPSREDAHFHRRPPQGEVAPREFLSRCPKLPTRWPRISPGRSTRSHRFHRDDSAIQCKSAADGIRRARPHYTRRPRARAHQTRDVSGGARIRAAQTRCALRPRRACTNRTRPHSRATNRCCPSRFPGSRFSSSRFSSSHRATI
jgi:hypothetical protein